MSAERCPVASGETKPATRDGTDVSLLDVFEVAIESGCATSYHPEDVLIVGNRCLKIRRFDGNKDCEFLKSMVDPEPIVLQGYCDRIEAKKFDAVAARVSLSLLGPDDLWWWIREDAGKRRYRACFRLGKTGRIRHDLPVTDPAWLDQLNLLPTGIHPHTRLCGKRHSATLLTASLSEPYEGFHYKLIAGVINLPA